METGSNLLAAREVFEWVCLLFAILLAAVLVSGLMRRERAGRILLDLGRMAGDRSTQRIGFGAGQVLLGVAGTLASGHNFRWSYFVLFALMGVIAIDAGLMRFLVYEKGVLVKARFLGARLLLWEDILAYDLDRGRLRLLLRDKGWIACAPRVRLDYQEELEALLGSRVRKPQPVAA